MTDILSADELEQLFTDFKNKAISITLDRKDIYNVMSKKATSKPLVWEIYMDKCLDSLMQDDGNGLYLEFGLAHGDTANFISNRLSSKTLYGFDSFKGLTEDWGVLKVGEFKRNDIPKLNKNVSVIKGFFQDTLVPFLQERLNKHVIFAHIDCDLYSSTAFVLEKIAPFIVPGTILCFDEICCHGPKGNVLVEACKNGEFKAFAEFCKKFDSKYELKFAANMMGCVEIC